MALAYAVSGYWQGFISGAFATTGLLLGGLLGIIWLAPRLFEKTASSLWVSLGALLVVLICASIGQAALQFLGARIRARITWQPVRALDALGGAALSTAAVLVVAWALGLAVSGSRLPGIGNQVRSSLVLSTVDSVMPGEAEQILSAFNDVVGPDFPRYLEPFATERIIDVGPPAGRIGRDPDVRDAEVSVLKVRGENDCGRGVEGTGFLYSPNRVMTNAHVVAGVDDPTVQVLEEQVPAKVVYYNSDLDIAVLAVGGLNRPHLRFDMTGETRDSAAVLGYPNDGPYNVQAARIRGEQRLRSPDIYGDGTVVREVFSIRGLVRPGNSGGPLVSPGGEVLGVIFAASVADPDTGYALTAQQVAQGAAAGLTNDTEVGTGPCA